MCTELWVAQNRQLKRQMVDAVHVGRSKRTAAMVNFKICQLKTKTKAVNFIRTAGPLQ